MKQNQLKHKFISTWWAPIMLGTASITLESTYSFGAYRANFNSDGAAFNLFALQMHLQHSLIPSKWYYANGDLFLFTPHLIMYLLDFTMKNQFLIRSISVLIFYFFAQYSTYRLLRVLKMTSRESVLAVCTLSAILSLSVREFFYEQGAYIGLFILTIWTIIFALKLLALDSSSAKKKRHSILLAGCVYVFTLSNPVRSFSTIIVPGVAAAVYVYGITNVRRIEIYKHFKLFFFPFICFFIAVLNYLLITKNLHMQNGINSVVTRDVNSTSQGFATFINGIGFLTGIAPGDGHHQISGAVIGGFLRLLLLGAGVYGVKKLWLSPSIPSKASLIFFLIVFLPSAYLMIFSGLAIDYTAGRYVMIPTILVIILGIVECLNSVRISLRNTFIVLSMILIALNIISSTSVNETLSIKNDQNIIKTLRGYSNLSATYWNASKYQILSNDLLSIQPVKWDAATCLSPFLWLNAENIVYPSSHLRNIYLTPNEYINLNSQSCQSRIFGITKFPNYWIVKFTESW